MHDYNIEFEVLESTVYSVSIEANNAREALAKFNESGFDRGTYHEVCFNGTEEERDVEVVGRWILDKKKSFGELKRFKKPIKLRKEK